MMAYRMLTDRELSNFRRAVGSTRGIPLREFGSGGAFDEAPTEEAPPRRGDLGRLLKTMARMSPENWAQLQRDLLDQDDENDEATVEQASDEPPPFPGRPRPGGAMDAKATNSFEKLLPDAARIGAGGVAYSQRVGQEAERSRIRRAGAGDSFSAMFPDAARLKPGR